MRILKKTGIPMTNEDLERSKKVHEFTEGMPENLKEAIYYYMERIIYSTKLSNSIYIDHLLTLNKVEEIESNLFEGVKIDFSKVLEIKHTETKVHQDKHLVLVFYNDDTVQFIPTDFDRDEFLKRINSAAIKFNFNKIHIGD